MKVLYFAWLRERVGVAAEEVAPPASVTTVGGLIAWLRGQSPRHAAAFADPRVVRCALDQDFASHEAVLGNVREVAFFPPVTGG
jgi:sulfur-carrier protein